MLQIQTDIATDKVPPLPAEVVERLFPAAIKAFAERDFHAVGMRDICAASGVSTATIYKYFRSKEALLFAILKKQLAAIDVDLRAAVARAPMAREQWSACFQALMGHYNAYPDFATVYFITVPTKTWISEGSWASFGSADFLQELAIKQQRLGEIDSGISPSMIASLVFMLCTREVQLWFYRGKTWHLTDRCERMTALFWKTVKT
ncbi:MAG: TetR/AcrR family transcriptional regulator [Mesorhizobium sp.]|nr:TetR/AcrR family transcriptional regulator [Mesorhizobium sp.]MCO5164594.1 TetR/AcrR family transcriptional regulator [Mesorhizobium sp.]